MLARIKVDAGYETALAAALGDDLDAPLDAEAPRHWGEMNGQQGDPDLPHDLPRLSDHVTAPERLNRRLNQIGIVGPSLGAGIQKLLKPGQRLVSREGDLWRWDGLVIRAGAQTPAAQRLEQQNRLEVLESRLGEAQKSLNTARLSFQEQRDIASDAAREEQAARSRWRDAQKTLSALRDSLARAERDANQLLARKATLEATLSRLSEEEIEAKQGLEQAQAQQNDLPDFEHLLRERDSARLFQGEKRGIVAEARAHSQGLSREAEMRQRRLQSIERERISWVSRVQNADAQIAILNERLSQTELEMKSLEDAPDEIINKRRALLSEISKAEEAQKEASDDLMIAERTALEAGVAAKLALEALGTTREARIRADERINGINSRKEELDRQIAEAMDCAPAATFGLSGLKQGAPLPAMVSVEGK